MGRYAGRFVVDTHCHAQRAAVRFAERGVKAPSTRDMYAGVAEVTWFDNSERLLYDMERSGFDMCILMSGGLARGMDNDLDAALVERHPDRFAALAYPTTRLRAVMQGKSKWSVEAALKETEERLKTGNYRGIGQGLPITESGSYGNLFASGAEKSKSESLSITETLDRCRAFMALAEKYGVAVSGLPHDERITGQLVAEFPKVPVVLQLVGWGRRAAASKVREVCEIAGQVGNVYLEMGLAPAALWEVALSDPNVGPPKLLFGTDWGASHYVYSQPGRPIRGEAFTSYVDWIDKWGPVRYQSDFWGWSLYQIDKLRDTITQDEINLILGGNAARIFKLDVPYSRLFPEARPDLWGVQWERYTKFLPDEQVKRPKGGENEAENSKARARKQRSRSDK
jgi:hypothetical protein